MSVQTDIGRSLVLALVLLACATTGQARTLTVNGDGTADYQYIRDAVSAAGSGDTIVIEQGTYTPEIDKNLDVDIDGKVLTIRGEDPSDPAVVAATVLDCQGYLHNNRAFLVKNPGTRLTLAGLTIINGLHSFSGGAIMCEEADLELINCTFTNNFVEWRGGAVYCRESQARFEGCTFMDNTSQERHGGAVYCENSRLELVNCSFEANSGLALESLDSDVTIAECLFQQNTGKNGGAIYSLIDAGFAGPAGLALTKCSFIDNSATSCGGAIHNYGVDATLSACTFTSNTAAQDGGAMYNQYSNPALVSCAFIGNKAAGLGGAILNMRGSSPGIINCTLVANEAALGGAVAGKGDSDPLISHCILWDNTATQGKNLYLGRYDYGVPTSKATVEYSDVRGGQTSVYQESGCALNWASGNIDIDPLFTDPLQGNYRPLAGSPCINAGDPDYAPEFGAIDLEGRARVCGSAVDIGAHEFPEIGPVYRFWSPVFSRHFYTTSKAERNKLIEVYPHVWTYENVAYLAFVDPIEAGLVPVHRFWSPLLEGHFYTIDEAERDKLIDTYSHVWTYEGVAFYAYPEAAHPPDAKPVYRFWSNSLSGHFYTISQKERDKLINEYSYTWTYEAIAWYARQNTASP